MDSRCQMATILVLFITWFGVCVVIIEGCDVDDVAVYKVKLRMLWGEDTFVKDYPTDKARWSKMFGQSHNKSYHIYQIGEIAEPNFQNFAQFGTLDHLMTEGDEEAKVYDQFLGPEVRDVIGESESMMFVDGSHSLVSMVCRTNPSPDWFVGVDSLDLCVDSSWVDQISLDLELLDAGVVNGVPFNQEIPWPTKPLEPIERIALRDPTFAGSNLYHHKVRHLPPVAIIEFVKMKEYSTKELNDLARKELVSNMKYKHNNYGIAKSVSYDDNVPTNYNQEKLSTKNPIDELRDLEEDPIGSPRSNNPDDNVLIVTKSPIGEYEEEFDEGLKNMDDVVLAVATGHRMGLGRHLPRHFKSRLHHAVNRNQHKHCLVSEWGPWSDCSDPCGSGEMIRKRHIIREKTRHGHGCPNLLEKKPCGGHHCRGDDIGW